MTKQRLVPYFRARNYTMPTDKSDTAFRYSAGLNIDWLPWIRSPGNEEHAEAYNKHMKFRTLAKKWYEVTPVAKILGPASEFGSKTKVLMVDVGGSTGNDLFGFHNKYPEYKGSTRAGSLVKTWIP